MAGQTLKGGSVRKEVQKSCSNTSVKVPAAGKKAVGTKEPIVSPKATTHTTKLTGSKSKTTTQITAQPEGKAMDTSMEGIPHTMEERIVRIAALAEHINGYIRFMCQVESFGSSSREAKEKAILAFYDRLVVVKRQLGQIQEDLWLG